MNEASLEGKLKVHLLISLPEVRKNSKTTKRESKEQTADVKGITKRMTDPTAADDVMNHDKRL